MARQLAFWFFVGAVLAIGVVFFRIVQPYLYPLMIAAVLALLFRPLYNHIVTVLHGHRRISAVLAAGVVLLAVVLPVAVGGLLAAQELVTLANSWVEKVQVATPSPVERRIHELEEMLSPKEFSQLSAGVQRGMPATTAIDIGDETAVAQQLADLQDSYSPDELSDAFRSYEQGWAVENLPWLGRAIEVARPYLGAGQLGQLRESSVSFLEAIVTPIYNQTSALVTNLIQFVIGFIIMALALYYFFVDGPAMLRNLEALLPWDNPDEEAVWEQFEAVCRGVVMGTILAAFAQAVLLGIGMALIGIERIWLLTGLTVLVSLIPFVGAAGVYVPVSLYLAWTGSYWSAFGLLVYGLLVVSSSDNLVRAYVIHGSSRLHPLAALVSVLGALSLVGLWGVFVGPIVAGIFYAMLSILHQKVRRLDQGEGPSQENTIKSTESLYRLQPARSLRET